MVDYINSTQYKEWFFDSLDTFKDKIKKSQRKMQAKLEKYTNKAKPIHPPHGAPV